MSVNSFQYMCEGGGVRVSIDAGVWQWFGMLLKVAVLGLDKFGRPDGP